MSEIQKGLGSLLLTIVIFFAFIMGIIFVGSFFEKDSSTDTVQQEEKEDSDEDKLFKRWENKGYVFISKWVGSEEKIVNLEIKAPDFHKRKMLIDTKDLLRDLSKIKGIQSPCVIWKADAQDIYGNTSEVFMSKFVFEDKTFKKINWDNVFVDDLPTIADEYTQNPNLDREE